MGQTLGQLSCLSLPQNLITLRARGALGTHSCIPPAGGLVLRRLRRTGREVFVVFMLLISLQRPLPTLPALERQPTAKVATLRGMLKESLQSESLPAPHNTKSRVPRRGPRCAENKREPCEARPGRIRHLPTADSASASTKKAPQAQLVPPASCMRLAICKFGGSRKKFF